MSFRGPLFILGAPRSGTKLVRDTLNQSSDISIPIHETKFIPKILEICKSEDVDSTFLLSLIKNSEFYDAHIREGSNYNLDNLRFDQADPTKIVMSIIKESDRARGLPDKPIWGDKSPFMELKLEIIAKSFPLAKYIYVIRDPRDVFASMRKMYPWRSITRFSFMWEKSSKEFLNNEIIQEDQILIVRYEDFIEDTSKCMEAITNFLAIPMTEKMSVPNRITEYTGDAKGRDTVMRNNSGKFKEALSIKEIRIIESICNKTMISYGYKGIFPHETGYEPSKSKIRLLQLRDYFLEIPNLFLKYGILSGATKILNKFRLRY